MILNILIAFFSLVFLIVLHEWGHFITAKRLNVKVEEFGIGLPPRIWGKKIGETIYSINLLPLGGFVKLPGEIEKSDDPRAFSNQSVTKRILIVLAGVISFWIISAVLFSIVFSLGVPEAISDEETRYENATVQVLQVLKDSPAYFAGIRMGDEIIEIKTGKEVFEIKKVKEIQTLSQQNKGKEISLKIKRGESFFEKKLTLRDSLSKGEAPMGVSLARIALKSYPFYLAPFEGVKKTFLTTIEIIKGYGEAIKNLVMRQPVQGELMGPVGIVDFFSKVIELGPGYYLQFLAIFSIYFAIFNSFPIPALDGGKLLFLLIEGVRKKPINPKIEERITLVFFSLLLVLMITITIKEVMRFF